MSAQRLTFRDVCNDVAWQKQLRDRYNEEGLPAGLSPDDLVLSKSIIKRVNRKIAESIILKYEWLGTLPPLTHFYGIFFKEFCAGVVCIGVGSGGANSNAYKELGLSSPQELAYMARGANVHWSPSGANSRLVSFACKLLAKDSGAKAVIAYSDTDAGEIGTIYQACNWFCVGRGVSLDQWVSPAGKINDHKFPYDLSRKHGGTRDYWIKRLIKEGFKRQKTNRKYRYVCPLDKKNEALMAFLKNKQVPYPKRVQSIDGDVPGNQHGEGGSSPT